MPSTASRALGVLGELLVTLGVLVLVFLAWLLWWTDLAAEDAQTHTVASLERDFTGAAVRGPLTGEAPPLDVQVGKPFATVRIPRFGSDYVRPVLEGTQAAQLGEGIGHTPGSAVPGRIGNFATAGHRVTYGKPYGAIDTLRPGDAIIVETAAGWSVYRYARHRIVEPHEVEVLAPVPDHPGKRPTRAWMTLVACDPPFSARQRYVGYAELDRFVPRASGRPVVDATAGR